MYSKTCPIPVKNVHDKLIEMTPLSSLLSDWTSAEERKLDCRFAYANPTLVRRRQADADLQPTITTFYRRWFNVTLQTGIQWDCTSGIAYVSALPQ